VSAVLRVGMAGAGWVTQHHLGAWATQAERAAVVAVADPDVAKALGRANEHGIEHVYDSVENMLRECELGAIDVAAPREYHAPICSLAAAHGLAILCQKPLAPTLAEAEALAAEVRGRVPFMVHENWRFRPHYRLIHDWLRNDRIGAVHTVRLAVITSGLLPDTRGRLPALERQPMLADLERMLLMEILIHHVDTLRFLFGPLTLEDAVIGKSCERIRGEDRASLLLRTADGAAILLRGDFSAYGARPEQRDALEIVGERGTIALHENELRVDGPDTVRVTLDLAANYSASYQAAIAHFVDGVLYGTPFETSLDDNLETLRIVEQAYEMADRAPESPRDDDDRPGGPVGV
jgi:predicted dehydrogenase